MCTAMILVSAAAAEAQTATTRWGVGGAIVPAWKVPSGSGPLAKLGEAVLESGDLGVEIDGADFRIGVVRGRIDSGEWGVSFVRRSMKDGSTQGGFEQSCFDSGSGGTQCFTNGAQYTYQDVKLTGLEVNKFIPVVHIKKRLQIGVDVAGGFGALSGTAELVEPENTQVPIQNAQGQFIGQRVVTTFTSTIVDAKELMVFDPTLLGRVEFAVAGILAPNLKVRFSAGMNFPGSHVASISASYFFGRN
jgi:hypothetical protein